MLLVAVVGLLRAGSGVLKSFPLKTVSEINKQLIS